MKRILKAFIYSFIMGIISLYSVAYFWVYPLWLTLGLIIISIILLLITRKKEDILLYITCGMAGAAAEYIAISSGAWSYSGFTNGLIPYWLPFLWGIAAIFIKKTALELEDYLNNKTKNQIDLL